MNNSMDKNIERVGLSMPAPAPKSIITNVHVEKAPAPPKPGLFSAGGPPRERHHLFSKRDAISIAAPVAVAAASAALAPPPPPPPPRRFRILHRYHHGYNHGYGYEYGYRYDPDYYLPYDPQYVENRTKIGILAGISAAVSLGGACFGSGEVALLGLGGIAVAGIAQVANKIKRRIRYNNQMKEAYEQSYGLSM
jgi:hypothetical protein